MVQGAGTEARGTAMIGRATALTPRPTASRHGTPAVLADPPAHVTALAPSGTGPTRGGASQLPHPHSQLLTSPLSVCQWCSLSPPCGGNLLWLYAQLRWTVDPGGEKMVGKHCAIVSLKHISPVDDEKCLSESPADL